ncbi:hypothetical protein [Bacillus phage FI_KG-Lek]|nr:hypothetical protein [Bacillus phage FI_KG-Lek]
MSQLSLVKTALEYQPSTDSLNKVVYASELMKN